MGRDRQLAWVESPLQLIAAAEFAAAQGRAIDVAFRLSGPQMSATAQALLDLRAPFSTCAPYYGIPWRLLSERRHWVVGDGLSGQFQLAMSTLGARAVTLLDDGIMTIRLARALAGTAPYARPGQAASQRRLLLASLTRDRLLAVAARESLTMFTAFAGHPAIRDLRRLGVAVTEDEFGWLRAHARPVALPSSRVVLGAAAVADGTITADRYLDWVQLAAKGDATYLPHRREPEPLLSRIAALPGVQLLRTGLPVELALAGTTKPLEIVSLRSTAAVTLRVVLAGNGSTIRMSDLIESVA
ncbi:MAG: hypothetical protein ABIQ01_13620 [Pseudolysinimonas sp.]